MSKKLTKIGAAAIAAQLILNDFDEEKALLACNYSLRYVRDGRGHALIESELVQTALTAVRTENAAEPDEVKRIIAGFRSIAFAPDNSKTNNSDRNTALVNLAKLQQMYDDKLPGEDVQQRELVESERFEALAIAHIRLKYAPEIEREVRRELEAEPEPFTDAEIIEGQGSNEGS